MARKKALNLTGKDVVSIDIGQHTTKIVAGKLTKNEITVNHAASIPTPRDSYEKGRITNFNGMKKSIGGVLDALKIRSRTALCSIETNEVITREVVVPSASDDQLEKMLEFEIQQYMPIELKDYMVQTKKLEDVVEDGAAKIRMLVTAVPKELAQNYYELLSSMNLQPAVLDIQSNSIDKLISFNRQINDNENVKAQAVAMVDIGFSHINVIVFENGSYKFNRSVNLGARNIDNNLANFMDISYDEAEKHKLAIEDLNRDFDLSDDMHQDDEAAIKLRVLNIVRNSIDSWVEEIERIFKYYTTRSTGNIIDVIYLYGGTADMKGLDQYFQDAFNIQTSTVNSLTNVKINHFAGEGTLSSYLNSLGAMVRR
ncbi:MAG: type IV pilus assembly protein PilM [Bacillota bacterium]|nr:type IV pilus assembly protein PilM [Bacillota bacterium]